MSKNIWLWNHYAIQMFDDKAGRQFWFSEYLIKLGYKVTVFCANTYHTKKECINTGKKKFVEKKSQNTAFIFIKTIPSIGNGLSRILNMVLFYLNLFFVSKSYIKLDCKPDVIIASSVHPLTMVAGIKIARRLNVPCICEVRDLWPEAIFKFDKVREKSVLGRILVSGEHWIYKKADALIFTKEGDTDYIKEKKWNTENGGDIELKKCHYINNGIDIEAYIKSVQENTLADKDLENNNFRVIYTGTIRAVNNVGNIIDTAIILKNNSDIQFLIYGEGNELEVLKKRIVDEGLNNVKIKGFIQRKYIPFVLSKSSINILNYSHSQYNWTRGNSSNKLFEYMASGKPIISTVKMGYSIIDKYKCGIELENSTPKDLSTAILKIKNMQKFQYDEMGLNAKNGAKDFDFNILTKKLIDVINSVT